MQIFHEYFYTLSFFSIRKIDWIRCIRKGVAFHYFSKPMSLTCKMSIIQAVRAKKHVVDDILFVAWWSKAIKWGLFMRFGSMKLKHPLLKLPLKSSHQNVTKVGWSSFLSFFRRKLLFKKTSVSLKLVILSRYDLWVLHIESLFTSGRCSMNFWI